MTATTGVLARVERFERVGSTSDVVRDWLAIGERDVCVAIADEQTAGRGRAGRTWVAPSGAALLVSLGFRPGWFAAERTWRLAAIVSLAMAEAGEDVASLPAGTIQLKWPNDLVVLEGGGVRKLGGVLGETSGLGTADATAIVGIGVNAGWRRVDFPSDLASSMTSLRDAAGDRPVERDAVLDAFIDRFERAYERLRDGAFDADAWTSRQVTTGRRVDIRMPDGTVRTAAATGVDARTGALLVDEAGAARPVFVGEISHVRLAGV